MYDYVLDKSRFKCKTIMQERERERSEKKTCQSLNIDELVLLANRNLGRSISDSLFR